MTLPDHRPHATRRRQARQQRVRRRKRVLAILGLCALAVLGALLLTDTLRLGGGNGPQLAQGVEPTPDNTSQRARRPQVNPRRAITPTEPLRLWIGGDSLAGSLGPSLGEMTAASGVVQPRYLSRSGSGLHDEGGWEWPTEANAEFNEADPEVVVFEIGTNDAAIFSDNDTAEYTLLVDQMMTVLTADGREVYWVTAPKMRDSDLDEGVQKVNAIATLVARRHPTLTIVDAYPLFADSEGEYASSLPDATGEYVHLRAGDGVHLSPEGGDLLAEAVFKVIDERWRITEQTVPGAPLPVIESEKSTKVPGTYRSGSSSGSSGTDDNDNGDNDGSSGQPPPASTSPPTVPPATTPSTTPALTSPPVTGGTAPGG